MKWLYDSCEAVMLTYLFGMLILLNSILFLFNIINIIASLVITYVVYDKVLVCIKIYLNKYKK